MRLFRAEGNVKWQENDKLQVSFFQELIIKQLRTLPEGDSIVLLYLKLLLKVINYLLSAYFDDLR